MQQIMIKVLVILLFSATQWQCQAQKEPSAEVIENSVKKEIISEETKIKTENEIKEIIPAADSPENYLSMLKGKKIGLITNQTGIVKQGDSSISIVDFLLENEIDIKKVFAPEHGFRGKADAGELVENGIDLKTGLPIISLYGKNKKPKASQIADIEVLLFDIQDVGVRFYTYISTLHLVMEAAAENGKKVIVLDRPNPNAHYIDGPILEAKEKTFVGMHPVPVVYGMTIGEYGKMINGEGWLKNGVSCDLKIIPIKNYEHSMAYDLPIKPSPNLPNAQSINLYPSLCFFEGTQVSEGRGTPTQFQVFGSPYLPSDVYDFKFTPKPNEGAKNPQFNGKSCNGLDLTNHPRLNELNLKWLIEAYKNYRGKPTFWVKNSGSFWIDKLAGTSDLRKQIEAGKSEKEIKETWQTGLNKFKKIRAKYLIYP